ncbi:major facilitator superfamily domain-containing protein [Corynascus novoguineensis]|uniref:Major facilitator superfamily domain-containing protein n=1 Tax=Corynascus novoguineensis TaxID=1126955 RepID=A0AAN7CW55_9PEZI|nr:major facilitator superfamily domain-containing protein [Corynascus novoguineensis]
MATSPHSIPLATRSPVAESPPALAPALPPISRKKQAAVLFSAFMTTALTIGYNQCFGVFQQYYLSSSQDVLVPSPASQASPPTALLAFVGTLCYGLTWAGGIVVNPVIARLERGTWTSTTASTRLWRRRALRLLSPRTITVSGVLITSAGFALASCSRSIWQLLLTQGFLAGVGMSLLYFPLLAPAPEYFTNHRATALGFILAGGGAGGLVFSPVIRALLSAIGGRWTLKLYALFNLIAGLPIAWTVPRSRFAGAVVTTASSSRRRRFDTHVSRALASRPTFLLSAAAAFLQAAGAQLPIAFIPSYTAALGLGGSSDDGGGSTTMGASLLAASSAVNAASRVLAGYAGDRLGRQNALVLTLLLAAGSVFSFWLSSALLAPSSSMASSLWITFIALYSFSAGGYYALFPALVADVFGIRQYAAVNAFILFVRGLGTLFGSPVGGQLLGSSSEGARAYTSVAYWDGALLTAATLCCIGVRWADAKGKGWRWIA